MIDIDKYDRVFLLLLLQDKQRIEIEISGDKIW